MSVPPPAPAAARVPVSLSLCSCLGSSACTRRGAHLGVCTWCVVCDRVMLSLLTRLCIVSAQGEAVHPAAAQLHCATKVNMCVVIY